MTRRRTRVLSLALAATAGINADLSGSIAAALVFAACLVPAAYVAVEAMREMQRLEARLDAQDERRSRIGESGRT